MMKKNQLVPFILGPTGVGYNTEVAKALAEQLFDTEKNIVLY